MGQPQHRRISPMVNPLILPGNDPVAQALKLSEDYFCQGWDALKKNSLTSALKAFDQAIEVYASDPRCYYARSFPLEALERCREALADIDKALEVNLMKPCLVIDSSIVNLLLRRIRIYINLPDHQRSNVELANMVRQLMDSEPSLDSLISSATVWPSVTPPSTPRYPPGFDSLVDSGFLCTSSPISRSRASTMDSDSSTSSPYSDSSLNCMTHPEISRTRPIFDSPLAIFGKRIETCDTSFTTSLDRSFGQLNAAIPSFPAEVDFAENDVRSITNPLGQTALFVRNVNRIVHQEDLLPIFVRFGQVIKFRHLNEKDRSAFVCYDTAEAALSAMQGLFNFRDQHLCHDPTIPWMLRFAPGGGQAEQQYKNAKVARHMVEATGECYNWRIGKSCHQSPCPFQHIQVNYDRDSRVTSESHAKRFR